MIWKENIFFQKMFIIADLSTLIICILETPKWVF